MTVTWKVIKGVTSLIMHQFLLKGNRVHFTGKVLFPPIKQVEGFMYFNRGDPIGLTCKFQVKEKRFLVHSKIGGFLVGIGYCQKNSRVELDIPREIFKCNDTL